MLPFTSASSPDTPYHLQVVLHIAENRFLTSLFKDQVKREVQDQLQLTFGPLARVEVVSEHPLLAQIQERGLQAALDGWESLSPRSTHFVLIDFVQGRYLIQWRSHHGATGMAGPTVREERIDDRRLVGHKVAELIEANFSLAGEVHVTGKAIELQLQGGRLAANLNRWIQPGAIFSVARITQEGERLRSTPVAWAVLRVVESPREGRCRCQWFHRLVADRLTPEPGVLYLAVQLHTDRAPLHLQLIDDETLRPLDGVPLQIFRTGFIAKEKPAEMTTNRDGLAVTRQAYSNVAFVRVLSRDTYQPRAQFPVEIIEGRTVVARLKLGAESEGLASLNLRRDLLIRRTYDQHRVVADRIAELNQAKSLEAALKSAESAKDSLEKEIENFVLEHGELTKLARLKKMAIDLGEAQEQIEQLRQRGKELDKFAVQLRDVIKESTSEEAKARKQLLQRARLLESQAEIEGSIKLYTQFLEADPKQTEVRSYLESLKAAWAPKSKEHGDARLFVYQIWPTVEVRDLKVRLPDAQKAFAECKQAGDPFTPRKLLHVNVSHAAKLKARVEALKRNFSPDNTAEAKTLSEVSEALRRLHTEVAAYLKKT